MSKQPSIVKKPVTMFYKLTFILLGISSLIGWNAVLSSFHFFAVQYGTDDVYTYFTVPLQIGNFIWGVLMPLIADRLSLIGRIAGGLTILSLILIFFPILAIIAPNQTGYIIALVFTFFIGSINSIAQNSMIALAGQEGGVLNMLYWLATGLSGLSMAVLSLVLNYAFSNTKDGELYSTIIFFAFASIISFVSIAMTVKYVHRKKYEQEASVMDGEVVQEDEYIEDDLNTSTTSIDKALLPRQVHIIPDTEDEQTYPKTSFFHNIKVAIKHVKFIPLFIWIIYTTTFTIFPGLTMQAVTKDMTGSKQLYYGLYLNLTYQIGDVIGKYVGGIKLLQKKILQYVIVTLRLAFIATSILAEKKEGALFDNEWFPFVNMALISITNGLCTASLMALAPRSGKDNLKVIETIGFICAFCLTFGIACGSIIAIPFK